MHSPPVSSSRSGVALIIVMLVVLAMGVTAGAFAYAMKVEARLAQNTTSNAELTWLGLSGVELAKWVLAQQNTIPGEAGYHGLNQFWATGRENPDLLPNPYEGMSLVNYPVGEGRVTVFIRDQERKINLNKAVFDRVLLERAITMTGAEASDADVLVNALVDWTDRDNNSQPGRPAETDDWYSRLTPPYQAKNGPIDDLGELFKVRGMTRDIYFGARGSLPDRRGPQVGGRGLGAPPPTEIAGFRDLFCAISSTQVNINTASSSVLTLILGGNAGAANAAETIVRNRAGPNGQEGDADDTPARNNGEIQRLLAGSSPNVPWQTANFTVRSSVFQVVVEATFGPSHQRYVALIQQQGPQNYVTMAFRQD